MQTLVRNFREAALMLCLLAAVAPTPGATITVTTTADSGAGSLRAALLAANNGDLIDAGGVSGTIALTTGELLVSNSVTVAGPGPSGLAVNGQSASRVFHITNDVSVLLSGLTITNGVESGIFPGHYGGGIWNDHATLAVSNCVISGNRVTSGSAGGIFNDGSFGHAQLSVVASTLSQNLGGSGGGGICNYGPGGTAKVIINSSTISGNNGSSVNGGGVFNSVSGGSATISATNSTFSANGCQANGGAIANSAFTGTGVVNVINCTFSRNSAGTDGGAIANNAGSAGTAILTILACTFATNSSLFNASESIYSTGTGAKVEMGGTILTAGSGGGNINNSGAFTSDGYNLSSDSGAGLLSGPGDHIYTEPKLGPLASNGGPTLTHALLAGSPAIDQGKNFGLATDQRGARRPFDWGSITNASGGDGSDIGAFELNPPSLNIARSGASVVLSWPASFASIQVQSATNLPAGTNWTLVTGSPTLIGDRYYLTNAESGPQTFYRLLSH
jgi:predicted outer membrane repeat protein